MVFASFAGGMGAAHMRRVAGRKSHLYRFLLLLGPAHDSSCSMPSLRIYLRCAW